MVKKILAALLVAVICVSGFIVYYLTRPNDNSNYSESTRYISNPGAGFYFTYPVSLKNENNATPLEYIFSKTGNRKYSLVHLRVDISDFSANAGGTDRDISANALDLIDDIFALAQTTRTGIIFRMAYSWQGQVNGSYPNAEPKLSLMLRHIAQMGAVIDNYPDVLMAVESGMLGPWGEQHSTNAVTPDNLFEITEAWLNSTSTVTVGVRRPSYFLHWFNRHYNTNYGIADIDQLPISQAGTPEYRVGVFNDGIQGLNTDLGTFSNREKEVAWLNNQAKNTLYGGEVVAGASFSHLAEEAFRTHLSYLNIEWNNGVIDQWRNTTYNGKDKTYKGKSQLKFMENRLGYRFVLKASTITKKSDCVKLSGRIKNVGFAPLIQQVQTTVVIKDKNEETISHNVNYNPNNENFEFEIPLGSLSKGEYSAFLCFSNGIEFANTGDIFDAYIRGNKLGTFTVG